MLFLYTFKPKPKLHVLAGIHVYSKTTLEGKGCIVCTVQVERQIEHQNDKDK